MTAKPTDKSITMKNIKKSFDGKEVLLGVSGVIGFGERVCITGESGCGKTTLANIICGIIKPDSGEITGNSRRKSVVFQEPRLIPNKNAIENIELVLDGKLSRRVRYGQAEEWLRLVELEAHGTKYPSEMSGGMQQRLSIARALAFDGEIMIFDEPFKAMDDAMKQRIIDMCKEKTNGKTVILISHDEEDAKKFVSKILQIKSGVLQSLQA